MQRTYRHKDFERVGTLERQAGFSLISTTIAIGISTGLMLVLANVLVASGQGMRNLQMKSSYVEVLAEVRQSLSAGSTNNCTENLRRALLALKSTGQNVNLRDPGNMQPFPITLSLFKPRVPVAPGTTPPPAEVERDILKPGEPRADGLSVASLRMVPRTRIGPRKTVLDLEIKMEKTGEAHGSKVLPTRRIPVFALMDEDGGFVSCGVDGATAADRVCDQLGNGEYIYNTRTGECSPQFTKKCYPGTATHARCEQGTVLPYSQGCYLSGLPSNLPRPPGHVDAYHGTHTLAEYCKPVGTEKKEVECVPRTDLVNAGQIPPTRVCNVCCQVEIVGSAIPAGG